MTKKQNEKDNALFKRIIIVSLISAFFFILCIVFTLYSELKTFNSYFTKVIKELRMTVTASTPNIEYYFSREGSDKNNGLSPDSPLLDPAPYFNIPGVSLFLKSGEEFYINEINITNCNIIISTYGGYEKAVINGLKTSNNSFIHAYDDVYSIVLDVPEVGAIIDSAKHNWSRVSSQAYLFNSGDYYYDKSTRTLYKKSSNNIEGTPLKYSIGQNGIKLSGASNVLIKNIEICGYGRHGINVGSNCSNISICDCFLHDIGGAELFTNTKYGNAIQVWSDNCHDISISNNAIDKIYDTGITVQNSKTDGAVGNSTNIIIRNNIVSNCYWGMEFYNNQRSFSAECFVEGNTVTDIRDITNGYRWDKSGIVGEKGGANALRFVGVNSNDHYYITNNIFANSEDAALFIAHDISGGIAKFENNVFVSEVPLLITNSSYYDGNSDVFYSSSYEEYIANGNNVTVIEDEFAAKSYTPRIYNNSYKMVVIILFLFAIICGYVVIKRNI